MTKKEFEKIKANIIKSANDRPKEIRYGQAIWSATYRMYYDSALYTLSDDSVDCFYNNKKVDAFFNSLEKELVNES